jgi:hypothetical protein
MLLVAALRIWPFILEGTSFGSPPAERGFHSSQVSIPSPPLHPRNRLKCLAGLNLIGEHLDEFLSVGTDPAPVADEPDGAEQVALDKKRVEPRDPSIGVDLVEHQGVLDGRARVYAPNLTSRRPFPTRLGFAECPATAGPMRLRDSRWAQRRVEECRSLLCP